MAIVKTYACDVCDAQATGKNNSLPRGWSGVVWRPGVLSPPGEAPRDTTPKHFCSEKCFAMYREESDVRRT